MRTILLRNFMRKIFLDPSERKCDKIFWLRSIIEINCIHKEELIYFIYILYGPTKKGFILYVF